MNHPVVVLSPNQTAKYFVSISYQSTERRCMLLEQSHSLALLVVSCLSCRNSLLLDFGNLFLQRRGTELLLWGKKMGRKYYFI